jgi:CDP-glycerol glycerophosphotransferase (TagB/SpsB family)
MLSKFIYFLDLIVPKKERIIFSSYPDVSDNAFALFNYMKSDLRLNDCSFVWLTEENPNRYAKYAKDPRVKIVKKNSFTGMYFYLSAKVAFYTHGLYSDTTSYNKKKRVNLWHGMPFKKVGALDDNFNGIVPLQDWLIVTSKTCAEIYSKSFKISEEKVVTLGQARNDLLKEETGFLKKKTIQISKYNKVVAWLPTYRKSNFGDIREDGVYSSCKVGFLDIKMFAELNLFLSDKNIFLIIKIHPMDVFNDDLFKNFKNILFIKNKDLCENDEQLYPILGVTDALITDYSSVFIDYLLLNKPMAFDLNDFEEYNKNRGFLFVEPKKMLAGSHIYNYEDLVNFLEEVLNEEDKFKNERNEIKKIYHKYYRFDSSKRITEWMLSI